MGRTVKENLPLLNTEEIANHEGNQQGGKHCQESPELQHGKTFLSDFDNILINTSRVSMVSYCLDEHNKELN